MSETMDSIVMVLLTVIRPTLKRGGRFFVDEDGKEYCSSKSLKENCADKVKWMRCTSLCKAGVTVTSASKILLQSNWRKLVGMLVRVPFLVFCCCKL